MKRCVQCTSIIDDCANFCPICGMKQPQIYARYIRQVPFLIRQLGSRLTAKAVIWIVIGGLQCFLSLLCFGCLLFVQGDTVNMLLNIAIYGTLGGLNIYQAVKDLKYSKIIQQNFVGILEDTKIKKADYLLWGYNILIGIFSMTGGGGIFILIGALAIAAVVVDALLIRAFVKANWNGFLALEQSQMN